MEEQIQFLMETQKEILECQKYPDLYNLAMKLEENGKHMPQQKLTLLPLRSLKKKITSNQSLPTFKINGPCGSECMT
jgi:hypothetical protein